jgi:alcohol oxidase
MGVYSAYPYSRGSIHITDKENVIDGYDFDTGFLNHPSDLKKQLWAYKMSREIARRLPYCSGELELGHPKFKADSKAAPATYNYENGEIKNIEYSKEDDEAIEDVSSPEIFLIRQLLTPSLSSGLEAISIQPGILLVRVR